MSKSLIIGADVGSISTDGISRTGKKKKKKVKKAKNKVSDGINDSLVSLDASESRLS